MDLVALQSMKKEDLDTYVRQRISLFCLKLPHIAKLFDVKIDNLAPACRISIVRNRVLAMGKWRALHTVIASYYYIDAFQLLQEIIECPDHNHIIHSISCGSNEALIKSTIDGVKLLNQKEKTALLSYIKSAIKPIKEAIKEAIKEGFQMNAFERAT